MHAPAGVVSTGWPAVERKCAELGVTFRPWQPDIGRLILAKRADGRYAATIGGVGLSIPRQTGKTFIVMAIVFALCLLRPNMTVLWTAHRMVLSEETFKKMQAFAKRAKIAPHVSRIVLGSGEEAIEFANGSRILFGARERGFGLGFDEVDVIVYDEAQRLRPATLDDMIPAANQSRQDTGALVLFLGTPPRRTDAGDVFSKIRTDCLDDDDPDTCWVEFGADDDYSFAVAPAPLTDQDWAQIHKANPSFPGDTPRESILRMRKRLGPESFLLEGAGIWPDPDANLDTAIDLAAWSRLKVEASEPTRATLVVRVSDDRRYTSIGVASDGPDGRTLVLVQQQPGTRWAVPAILKLQERHGPDLLEVALNPRTRTGALVPALTAAGVEYETLTGTHEAQACSSFLEAVKDGTVGHVGQAELDAAVANTGTRLRGDGEVFEPIDPAIDISPVRAASMAALRWASADVHAQPFNIW